MPSQSVNSKGKKESYTNLDYQVAASTKIVNDKLESKSGLPSTDNHQYTNDSNLPESFEPNLVKAILVEESDFGQPGPNGTGDTDPMQSNYPGDYNSSKDVKEAVGLSKNQEMTPNTSIQAGLGIFLIKGMTSDSKGNYKSWRGTADALTKYHSGPNKDYSTNILNNKKALDNGTPIKN